MSKKNKKKERVLQDIGGSAVHAPGTSGNTANKKILNEAIIKNLGELSRLSLSQFVATTHGDRRKLYEIFGYILDPDIRDFIARFKRQDIAKRIVRAYPEATWRDEILVSDDDDTTNETDFEKAWLELVREKNVLHYLNRLDILANLGRYSVLLIGAADIDIDGNAATKLQDPIETVNGLDGLLYLMPYSEESATIQKYDEDITSPRYNMPEMYTIETGGFGEGKRSSTVPKRTIKAHHSRVIHVAQDLLENDVLGEPILEAVLNRLMDLEKVVGGAAETFWINSRGGLHVDVDKEMNLESDDSKKLQKAIDDYVHNLTRVIRTQGIDVNNIQAMVSSPKDQAELILNLIAGTTGIPVRILLGSERGELASSQDEDNWANRVLERRSKFAEPMILRSFIDKMIEIGVLPEPKAPYKIVWPSLVAINPKEQAEISLKKSQAISTYSNSPGAELLVTPKQFVEEVIDLEFKEDDINKAVDIVKDEEAQTPTTEGEVENA